MTDSEGRPQGTRPRDIALNTFAANASRVVQVLLFLGLLPFILHRVGAEQYGLWTLIWSVVSLLGLVNMGFSAAVVKYVADARGRADQDRLRRVVCTLFWVFVGQASLLLLLVFGLTWGFGLVFDIGGTELSTARFAFFTVGAAFALQIPLGLFQGLFVGSQRAWIAHAHTIVFNLLYGASVLLFFDRFASLEVLALLNVQVTLLPALAMAVHAWLTMPGVALHPRHFDRALLGETWRFSMSFMVIQVASLVATRVDALVINGARLPLTEITLYGFAMRISEQATMFCLQFARVLTPVVAELHGAGEEARLRRLWIQGTKAAVAFAVPLMVGCAALAHPLIATWVGPQYHRSATILQILLAAHLISVVHSHSYNLLSMRGEERLLSRALIVQQAINLILSLVFVWFWGIFGVALATLLAALPTDLGVVQRRLAKRYGLSPFRFYASTVGPSLAPAIVMLAVLWALQRVIAVTNLFEVAALEAVGMLVFGLCFWVLGTSRDERQLLQQALAQRMTRRRALSRR